MTYYTITTIPLSSVVTPATSRTNSGTGATADWIIDRY